MNRDQIKALIKDAAAAGGSTARHAFLSLALLRGVPYRALELTRREAHVPSATKIASVLECEVPTVLAWLGTPATGAMWARHSAARLRLLNAKAQRAKAFAAARAPNPAAAE